MHTTTHEVADLIRRVDALSAGDRRVAAAAAVVSLGTLNNYRKLTEQDVGTQRYTSAVLRLRLAVERLEAETGLVVRRG